MDEEKRKKEEIMSLLSSESKQREVSEEKQTSLPNEHPNDLTIAYQRTQIEKLREEVESLKQDREQRKIFGYIIFGFMCVYMAAALVLVFLSGFHSVELSDGVLITLLTTTLANVIGIFNFVAKYLFHAKG